MPRDANYGNNPADEAAMQLEGYIKELMKERDLWRALAENLDKLCTAYRTGRRPSEKVLDQIPVLRAKLKEIENGCG
jgi:hypothetical protein